MNSPRDPLSSALRDWQVKPPGDPQFRARVWERIEAERALAAAPLSWSGFARGHAAVVAGVLAMAIVGGAAGGRAQARAQVAKDSAQLASAYVQSLDARSMPMR